MAYTLSTEFRARAILCLHKYKYLLVSATISHLTKSDTFVKPVILITLVTAFSSSVNVNLYHFFGVIRLLSCKKNVPFLCVRQTPSHNLCVKQTPSLSKP
ncbi:hypothetical protein XENOCAPTIV_019240 [Xenoophorus captivus]|uniref:Uncharacterized protein n=1 Tax=Xenoophorus captivus TaxID=1517983 RepID=A0ABV0S5E8_9TELE